MRLTAHDPLDTADDDIDEGYDCVCYAVEYAWGVPAVRRGKIESSPAMTNLLYKR